MKKQARKTGRRANLWPEEEGLLVQRKDTRRVLSRGGLKFEGYDQDGLLLYRIVKSKMIGNHSVRKGKCLVYYKRKER